MAYVPEFENDIFVSYSHADDVSWIERLKSDLEISLIRKLRATVKPSIFFDAHDLRAGRLFDSHIPSSLEKTIYFLAAISPRYNASNYCRHMELAHFLRNNPVETGRIIQLWLDSSAPLPLPKSLAVSFAAGAKPMRPGTDGYDNALRIVVETIVQELDKLYAQSKMIFLAWPANPELRVERDRLQSEIEGRGLRVYPEAIAEYEDDIRLRDALQACGTSVHFFGSENDEFARRQFAAAKLIGKPSIVASKNRAEVLIGPVGSPSPIYLDQGNPTIAIANALDSILGRGRRDDQQFTGGLGKTGLYLVFKPDDDATLGLRLRQRIKNRGPFEVIEPGSATETRYADLSRAKAAVVCIGKAEKKWLADELDALNLATVSGKFYEMRRAIYTKTVSAAENIDLLENDRILHTDSELDQFLAELHPRVEGAVA
jgi:hypothetical protein